MGKAAIRNLIGSDITLRAVLQTSGIESTAWVQLVGDAIFLVEGGLVRRRLQWGFGDQLRLPFRPLVGAFRLGEHLSAVTGRVASLLPRLQEIRRQQLIHQGLAPRPPGDAQTRPNGPSPDKVSPPAPRSRWDDLVNTGLPAVPPMSELGLVTAAEALAAVDSLRPGSRPGWVCAPVPLEPKAFDDDELDWASCGYERVPIAAIPTLVELDRTKLEGIIRGELKPQMPVAIVQANRLYLYRNSEDAWARRFLGDEEIVVKIVSRRGSA